MARIVCCGEGMVELAARGADAADGWSLSFGGDTLNTAIHLARAGHETAYLTALGSDAFSTTLREKWRAEGLDCALVLEHPSRGVGLYAISLDAHGERNFTYWRDSSAAREMFALPAMVQAAQNARGCDLFSFSLITLAILPDEGRQALLDLAGDIRRRGGRVAFDGNYRPRLWRDATEAVRWRDAAITLADIGLPTFEDEATLGLGTAAEVRAHWQGLGCGEVIVKLGADGCVLPDGTVLPPPAVLKPVDTSGAGDAFNGGYLAARLNGALVTEAVLAGHERAGWCIMRRGAIPPRER